jgi:hypothetical protein
MDSDGLTSGSFFFSGITIFMISQIMIMSSETSCAWWFYANEDDDDDDDDDGEVWGTAGMLPCDADAVVYFPRIQLDPVLSPCQLDIMSMDYFKGNLQETMVLHISKGFSCKLNYHPVLRVNPGILVDWSVGYPKK